MKRFWTSASARAGEGGWVVELDGRPLRTPARAILLLPWRKLADAIAVEWASIDGEVNPRLMPLTGLANAAIDRIAPNPPAFADSLARYGESDLLCYRAGHPQLLVDRQSAAWDPLLDWARRRYDVDFRITQGVGHVAQPDATIARLAQEVGSLSAFQLAGLSPLVTIGGSLVAALAIVEKAMQVESVWCAVTLDEEWQRERWGEDSEAVAALDNRHREFLCAARFLAVLEG